MTPVPVAGEARKALELPSVPVELPRAAEEPPASLEEACGQIARLEDELSSTKQYLQTIIEELRSANEEAQSSNEELQSSNEELQTAKEELQSSNEELVTLNAEAQDRNVELGRLNDDLENLLGNLNVPIVMVDGNLRIRRFTPVAEKVLNLIATDVGRPISDLKPRINVPNLEEILRHVIETLAPHEQEVEDQEGRWYSLRLRPYRTLDNRIEGAVLQLVDVTERKRAAEARYRRLFEASRDGILIADALTGEITDANPFAEQLLGYSLAELVGRRLWDAGPLREIPQARDLVARALEDGMVPSLEMTFATRDGNQMQVEAVANAYDEGGRKVVQFSVRDITERKRFESQLLHTQKLESLGLLAGGIAHDFNNLLTSIMGNASLAMSEVASESTRVLLGQVVRASERAANLTRQMLAYAGKGRLATTPIDLNELIAEVSVLIRSSLPKIVVLQFDLKDDLPFIEGDPGQVQQIVMNLVINGAEAVAEGRPGSVTIRSEVREFTSGQLRQYTEGEHLAPGRYVSLEVVDTGSGMDEATKARIFDPFFTTKFTGRGLGLAAVLGIIRSHQGAIRVDSRLGRGTSFQVLFPAAAPMPEKRPAIPAARSLAGTGTVLVVDDEEPVRLLAKAGLERNGYQVILADNGSAAVRIFRARHAEISLVVLDRTMPVMGGEEALDQIQAIDAKVPVILSSGYDEASTLEQVAGSHLAGFVQKPYTVEVLLEAIQKALTSPRSR
jgi:PAS domain S-box-containing protein